MKSLASITKTQAELLAKKYSCVELVQTYLTKIKTKNPDLNAFITVCEETSLQQAKKTDDLIANLESKAFEEYPLTGVTISHKDLFLTKGVRTTAGSKVLENYYPQYSATVVEKLERAGGITLGKTNCDAWAHGSSGENSDFGPTKNPFNLDYVPGGSSSGSAASVSAGLSLIATGTDTGGSIRLPANFCGVYGLKPTYGLVSRYGIVSMASSLDTVGHLASSVDDIEKVFNVTKGTDGFDSTLTNSEDKLNSIPVKNISIGIPKEYFVDGLNKEVEKAVSEVIKIFKTKGFTLKEISLPHTKYAITAYYIIQPAEVSSNLARYDGVRYGSSRESFGLEAKRRIMLGTFVLSSGYHDAYYKKATLVRSLIIQDFDTVFREVDVILAPVSPTPPFKIGEKLSSPLELYLADIFTVPANLAGIPGLSIPYGSTSNGLPLGFQILGPRFSEQRLFSLAKFFEDQK